jgi:hypothetical protein
MCMAAWAGQCVFMGILKFFDKLFILYNRAIILASFCIVTNPGIDRSRCLVSWLELSTHISRLWVQTHATPFFLLIIGILFCILNTHYEILGPPMYGSFGQLWSAHRRKRRCRPSLPPSTVSYLIRFLKPLQKIVAEHHDTYILTIFLFFYFPTTDEDGVVLIK